MCDDETEARARSMLRVHYLAWMRYGFPEDRRAVRMLAWVLSGFDTPSHFYRRPA